jgi:hypothetical protein
METDYHGNFRVRLMGVLVAQLLSTYRDYARAYTAGVSLQLLENLNVYNIVYSIIIVITVQ